MLALWAEMNLVVADEFRDGNVPAQQQPLGVAQRAFAALPPNVTEYYFRGDSGCHEAGLVGWLRDEKRAEGPQGRIGFAVSVRMFPSLKKHIQRLSASAWKPYRTDTEADSECADVLNYWPESGEEKEFGALRWIAIRVRNRQGELFADGKEHKYFAVMTNLWEWKAKTLLEWRREKAGTIRSDPRHSEE
jgi:hypothetical protein